MALLAEEMVEEYFNRKGYLTIRGIKLGVHEIDVVGTRILSSGERENIHVEVQASIRPVSYISKVPIAVQRTGRASNSMKRSEEEIVQGVKEWVEKKYFKQEKVALLTELLGGPWERILVINNVKSENEVELIEGHGIRIMRLSDLVSDIESMDNRIKSASHADLVDLLELGQTTVDSVET